ncbi:uncharacterized protein METZ01_LOCUS48485 [marine metagenome]|uniref:Glycosyl transferase family 28 C-terminal domain-containing protein n=1 Tax=marine metagenome TaxID=408172 RepID=A0A381RWX4_9ZZZZ
MPGLAIARAVVDRGLVEDAGSVHLVGSRRGVESELVPSTEFGLSLLPGRGLRRSFTPGNLVSIAGLFIACLRSVYLVLRLAPRVVVATGGYACVPCGLAAVALRVPLIVAEQNAVPGAASRLLSRFAQVAAVSFPGTDLPRAVMTGNPVRPEIRDMTQEGAREAARERMAVGDRDLVAVFGGSLGARRINQAVERAVADWDGPPLVVHHVVGRRDWTSEDTGQHGVTPSVDYRRVAYEDDMASVLVASDLAICRAGATSLAELAVLGIPSILIPLSGAPGDHQSANAQQLAEAGGAVVLEDENLSGDRLRVTIGALLSDGATLTEMASRAKALGRPDAADRVADLVAVHGGFNDS